MRVEGMGVSLDLSEHTPEVPQQYGWTKVFGVQASKIKAKISQTPKTHFSDAGPGHCACKSHNHTKKEHSGRKFFLKIEKLKIE
jgi:hypothetical protein